VANVPGKKVEHQGIKVQLLGQIELASERGHPHDFVSLGARPAGGNAHGAGASWPARGAEARGAAVRDLAPAGELTSPQTYPFEFDNVEMQYDSYRGLQVRLRCAPPRALWGLLPELVGCLELPGGACQQPSAV
jgi:vacuolar protein sorting-associated protein 26